ncbi:unnamed protein product [Meganyctiphanes norvegica]|uniref:Amidohydrolase-related domain-containing protein n=1 Tax=Meganyctiphanes norvegica TaxID=48144 RepID=A0AAV2RQP1_MEGNR
MENWADEILDSHCHMWELSRFQYPWPTPDMLIGVDHLAVDLMEAVKDSPSKGDFIFVQCLNESPEEAKWVQSLANVNPRIKGIVAGIDPTNPKLVENINTLRAEVPLLVGSRHIPDLDPRKNFFKLDETARGVTLLHQHGLTYDLLLRPPIIEDAAVMVSKVPGDARIVVDHIAKPYIKDGTMEPWREHIAQLARYPNVHCKLSGMVTETKLDSWKADDLKPYVEYILSLFGTDRVMFGSDWPVCKLAGASYGDVINTLSGLLGHLTHEELKKIFCTNARKFYNIE